MKNMSKALPRRQEQVRDYPVPPEREGDKTSGNRVTLPEPASTHPKEMIVGVVEGPESHHPQRKKALRFPCFPEYRIG
jgi:hypothetical protein